MKFKIDQLILFLAICILFALVGLLIYFVLSLHNYEYFNGIVKREDNELYLLNLTEKQINNSEFNININIDGKIKTFQTNFTNEFNNEGIKIHSDELVMYMKQNNLFMYNIFISVQKERYWEWIFNEIKNIIN
ncbi:MAG1140 family protein [Mycoplasmopsis edwardii]|uniref:Uncharacterized protein n=1 Tax=Mycoplasmopsis edwardii TaxID=53558 RepID=A0ACD4PJA9_9BACT|nr:hypothetical protein [Mycoplasmopsis edwardii]WBP84273.1 hypothetical protein Me_995_000251 [Mycoplasmopsis edwardii]